MQNNLAFCSEIRLNVQHRDDKKKVIGLKPEDRELRSGVGDQKSESKPFNDFSISQFDDLTNQPINNKPLTFYFLPFTFNSLAYAI